MATHATDYRSLTYCALTYYFFLRISSTRMCEMNVAHPTAAMPHSHARKQREVREPRLGLGLGLGLGLDSGLGWG